jgi:hypothetical protein
VYLDNILFINLNPEYIRCVELVTNAATRWHKKSILIGFTATWNDVTQPRTYDGEMMSESVLLIFTKHCSAEVKKMWIYTSTPPYAFMA